MKWRFEWLYRAGLVLLFVGAFWSVWASAQQTVATNTPNVSSASSMVTPDASRENKDSGNDANKIALTFGLDRVELFCKSDPLLGEPYWKYLASLIYILLAFYISKILDFIIGVWLKRLAAKSETKYDDLVLDLLRGPVKVVAFVVFLHIGLAMFDWPPKIQLYLSKGLVIVVACSITYVALKAVDMLLGVWLDRNAQTEDKLFAAQLFPLVRKVAKVTIVITAIVLTADNLGGKITSLLAGLSIGGLALGLAAQDTVANLFGAVAIFLDKPFRIGDMVKVEGVQGHIEQIGLRSTRIRNLDGHLVAIPNKTMGNAIITNITRRPTIRTEMNIGITYDTPTEKVKRATEILDEIYRADPMTRDLIISFNKFNDSALNIFVVHIWDGTEGKEHFASMQVLNLKIKERFDAEKIEFAFPTQTLHVKQG
jgi:MscS family membrane protein